VKNCKQPFFGTNLVKVALKVKNNYQTPTVGWCMMKQWLKFASLEI